MAEILLNWVDKVPSSDPIYNQNYKQGDVIAICPDGWVWSNAEQINPNWRIVKLPNVTVAAIQNLTYPVIDAVTGIPTKKRGSYINATLIPTSVANQINKNQVLTSNISQATLLSWIANHT